MFSSIWQRALVMFINRKLSAYNDILFSAHAADHRFWPARWKLNKISRCLIKRRAPPNFLRVPFLLRVPQFADRRPRRLYVWDYTKYLIQCKQFLIQDGGKLGKWPEPAGISFDYKLYILILSILINFSPTVLKWTVVNFPLEDSWKSGNSTSSKFFVFIHVRVSLHTHPGMSLVGVCVGEGGGECAALPHSSWSHDVKFSKNYSAWTQLIPIGSSAVISQKHLPDIKPHCWTAFFPKHMLHAASVSHFKTNDVGTSGIRCYL